MAVCEAQHRAWWGKDEDQFLLDNIGDYSDDWIAAKLGRKRTAILVRVRKFRLLNQIDFHSWPACRDQVPRPTYAQLKRGVHVVNLFNLNHYLLTGHFPTTAQGQMVEAVRIERQDGNEVYRLCSVKISRIALVSVFEQWYPPRHLRCRRKPREKRTQPHATQRAA
jgi:hypothetical protein